MERTTKLTIIITHPVQHFSPVYKLLAEMPGLQVLVIYFSDAGARGHFDRDFGLKYQWDVDLLGGYRSAVIESGGPTPSGFWRVRSAELFKLLKAENPDAVMVYGYSHLMEWQALLWTLRHRRRLLYISDSTLVGYSRSAWRRLLKDLPVRTFFRRVHTFLAVGDRNVEYLRHYGASASRINQCPLSVDIGRFRNAERDDVLQVRRRITSEESAFVILFSGKFIPRKRPLDVIAAAAELNACGVKVVACLLGSGPLDADVRAAVDRLNAHAFVHLAGFINQREIPLYYHASDACVITSERDAHPLIATEAAACGLPIIASANIGCIGPRDVVRDGINGIVYESGNVKQLASAIEKLVRDRGCYGRMAQESRRIAETQDIAVAAEVIAAAARA